jgi:hypothetical protein
MNVNTSTWTPDIIEILKKIRINSFLMSVKHKEIYQENKSCSQYFDLPTIVLSIFSSSLMSFNSVPLEKKIIVNTSISMFIAILTSIKLYLNLNTVIQDSETLSHQFYLLSINIYKILELSEDNRKCDGIQFLNDSYNEYIKLLDSSALLKKSLRCDALTDDMKLINKNGSVVSSNNSLNSLDLEKNENPFLSDSPKRTI